LAIAILAAFLGCTTRSIHDLQPIQIPAGLSGADAKFAILAAASQEPLPLPASVVPRATDARGVLIGSLLDTIVRSGHASQPWYVESQGPGWVQAGLSVRSHYLSVRLSIHKRLIEHDLLEAENLRRKGDRIHGNGVQWISDLQQRIRRNLSVLAAYAQPTSERTHGE
jgi:hypothetical protein